ncbi:hypothetical protein R6Z07F_008873 [Ovis aries]
MGLAVREPLWRTGATLCGGFCRVSFTSCWLSAALWFLTCLPGGLGKPEGGFYATTLSEPEKANRQSSDWYVQA